MDKQIKPDLEKLQQMRSLLDAITPLVEYVSGQKHCDGQHSVDEFVTLKMSLIRTLAEEVRVAAQERLDDFHAETDM